jgi:hypothetical protein
MQKRYDSGDAMSGTTWLDKIVTGYMDSPNRMKTVNAAIQRAGPFHLPLVDIERDFVKLFPRCII